MTMPSRHILFADDDVLTQWIMTDVLTQAGFAVTNACRGTEAIDLLDDSAAFDLLLTDIDLPENSNGQDLADHWRSALPRRPVIYTGSIASRMPWRLEWHEHFIAKPVGAAMLLRLVDWALEDASFRPMASANSRRGLHVH